MDTWLGLGAHVILCHLIWGVSRIRRDGRTWMQTTNGTSEAIEEAEYWMSDQWVNWRLWRRCKAPRKRGIMPSQVQLLPISILLLAYFKPPNLPLPRHPP